MLLMTGVLVASNKTSFMTQVHFLSNCCQHYSNNRRSGVATKKCTAVCTVKHSIEFVRVERTESIWQYHPQCLQAKVLPLVVEDKHHLGMCTQYAVCISLLTIRHIKPAQHHCFHMLSLWRMVTYTGEMYSNASSLSS